MLHLLAVPAALIALAAPFHARSETLPPSVRTQLVDGGFWHRGCPVGLGQLRVLTVSHRDWQRRPRTGQLIVNRTAVVPLTRVFRALYRAGFPIRHMQLADYYGPRAGRPADGDVTESFECREAAASPCTGKATTGTWSNHAYGLAVDLNTRENPYVGCGQSRDPTAQSYRDRTHRRRGMVGAKVIAAFAAVGWDWGGAWSGNTKDYMHFSHNGH
jgi:hypothetical protein